MNPEVEATLKKIAKGVSTGLSIKKVIAALEELGYRVRQLPNLTVHGRNPKRIFHDEAEAQKQWDKDVRQWGKDVKEARIDGKVGEEEIKRVGPMEEWRTGGMWSWDLEVVVYVPVYSIQDMRDPQATTVFIFGDHDRKPPLAPEALTGFGETGRDYEADRMEKQEDAARWVKNRQEAIDNLRKRAADRLAYKAEVTRRAREALGMPTETEADAIKIRKQYDDTNIHTCPICFRPIRAGSGRIADHGFQAPGRGTGAVYRHGSCSGTGELPWEASSGATRSYLLSLLVELGRAEAEEPEPEDRSQEWHQRKALRETILGLTPAIFGWEKGQHGWVALLEWDAWTRKPWDDVAWKSALTAAASATLPMHADASIPFLHEDKMRGLWTRLLTNIPLPLYRWMRRWPRQMVPIVWDEIEAGYLKPTRRPARFKADDVIRVSGQKSTFRVESVDGWSDFEQTWKYKVRPMAGGRLTTFNETGLELV